MEQEEFSKKKEIELLMESIKESYIKKKDTIIVATAIGLVVIDQYFLSDRGISSILWDVFTVILFLLWFFMSTIAPRKINRAATAQELWAIHDRTRILDLSLLLVLFVVCLFIPTMSVVIKSIILILLVLRAFSRWVPIMGDYWLLNDIKRLRELVNDGE